MTLLKKVSVQIVVVSATLAGLAIAGPVSSANALELLPESGTDFRMTYQSTTASLDNGNALSTGARLVTGDPNLAIAAGQTVIGPPRVNVVANADTTVGYTSQFLACSSRTADVSSCRIVASSTLSYEPGRAPDSFQPAGFVPTADQVGSYIAWRFTLLAKNSAGLPVSQTVVSTRRYDPLVLPGNIPTSRPPVVGVNGITAGQVAGLLVYPWTMPTVSELSPQLTVTQRSVTVWVCDSKDAGNVASPNWTPTGCATTPTVVGAGASASGNLPTVFSIPTTEDMGGKYLVSQVSVVTTTPSGSPSAYVIRRTGTLLPVASAAPSDAGAGAAAALGDEAVSTIGTEALANSGLASADAKTAAQAQNQLSSGALVAIDPPDISPVQPTVRIVAKNKTKRGARYLVSVKLSGNGNGTIGTGPAKVQLVTSKSATAKAAANLKTIEVEDLVGAKYEIPSKKLKPGTYYLRVTFTDAGSGVKSTALKKIRLT